MRRFRFFAVTLAAALLFQGVAAAGASAASSAQGRLIADSGSAPAVKALYPVDDASSVPTNSKLLLEFTEPVKLGSGSVTIKNSSTFELVASYSVSSSQVKLSASGTVATVSIEQDKLQPGTGYYVQVSSGAFKSKSGDVPYSGITDALSWNFQVGYTDLSAPSPISFSPANNATVSDLGAPLVLKFNEPVLPGSGNVVVRDLSGGKVLDTIPANSVQVTGAGTDTITIRPDVSYKSNMVYAVVVDEHAFTDMSGNFYAGMPSTDTTTWRFTTTTDTVPPDLLETTPASGANYVQPNGVLKMRFNKPVHVAAGAKGIAIPASGSSGSVDLVLGPDNASIPDPNVITLTPAAGLASSQSYIVHVPENAILDAAGNFFPGILNDYRWTFQTLGSDRTAPVLSTATMDGSVILLTYSEPLNESAVPYASNYYVTVNDVPRQVNDVAVSGTQVRLTLQSGVAVGQTVKLSYTVGDSPLRDLSSNNAAGFSSKSVSNTTTTTLAKPISGSVSGSSLTVVFNKSLQSVSPYASSQFTVKVNGTTVGISSMSVSGTSIVFSIYSSVATGQTVSVSYTPGSYPVQDTSGNALASFSDFYLQNASDTTPPVISSASVSGNRVTLNYNEGLNGSVVPLRSSFSVLVNGVSNQVTGVAVSNNSVQLTLASSVASSNVVLVTYIPGSPAIRDLAGNAAAGLSNYQVVSGSSSAASLSTAAVKDSSLTLTYSSTLNSSSVPFPLQFVVKANGQFVNVTNISISGSSVVLSLEHAVKAGQSVTLTYYNSGTPLQDASGQTLAGINEMSVQNQSSTVDNVPDYTGSDADGGLQLDALAASAVSGITPSGQAAKRYVLDGDKFVQAIASLKTNASQLSSSQVTFTVPGSEAGALVSIPVASILRAATLVSNASFRVQYGNMAFTFPLNAFNYSQELAIAGWAANSTSLYLAIEKTSNSQLNNAVSSQGGTMMASPATFAVSLSSGGNEREIKNYSQAVTRTFTLGAGAASPSELSVVRYDSEIGDIVYVPTKTKTANGQLDVNFVGKGNGTFAIVRKNKQVYSDMATHWARNDVAALGAKFIVTTPTKTTFAPNRNITREEFAEFIARGLGLAGDRSSAARFPDAPTSGSAAAYIGAVSQAGIVQGDEKGRFNPNASITREEMATMMLRAMTYAGTQPGSSASVLNKYSDRGKIGSWASSAVAANVEAGIMNGVSATEFKPKANATRAEAAAMVKRFLEYAGLFES